MKCRHVALVALVAAVTLTSVAAAGRDAAKQRAGLTMTNLPNGAFMLTPLQSGPLKRDSGTVRHTVANYTPRIVMRDGQRVSIYKPVVWLLEGKRGTLTIREPRNAWVDAGGPEIGTGTWKVVRGTGRYARISGAAGVPMRGSTAGRATGPRARRAFSRLPSGE